MKRPVYWNRSVACERGEFGEERWVHLSYLSYGIAIAEEELEVMTLLHSDEQGRNGTRAAPVGSSNRLSYHGYWLISRRLSVLTGLLPKLRSPPRKSNSSGMISNRIRLMSPA